MRDPPLLRTPAPIAGEHYLGYVLRLARANGYLGYGPIARDLGLGGQTPISATRAWLSGTLDYSTLARRTGHDADLFWSTLVAEHEDPEVGLGTAWRFEYFRTTTPRLCPKCLARSGHVHAIWDFTPITYCRTHRVVLVDVCPACHRRITWGRPSPSMCKCGFDLRLAPTPSVPARVLATLASTGLGAPDGALIKPNDDRESHVTAVHQVIAELCRPLDLMPAKPDLNAIPNALLHELYVRAANHLRYPKKAANWRRARTAAGRSLFPILGDYLYPDVGGTTGDAASANSRQGSAGQDFRVSPPTPLGSVDDGMRATQRYAVSQVRIDAAGQSAGPALPLNAEVEDDPLDMVLRRQVDLQTLTQLLPLSAEDIHSLVHDDFIRALHEATPRYSDWLFDALRIEQVFADLPASPEEPQTDWVSLEAVLKAKRLQQHNTALGCLLRAITQGTLELRRTPARGLGGFLLFEPELHRWLVAELERPRDEYTMHQLARVLGTLPAAVSQLVKADLLEYVPGKRAKGPRVSRISGASATHFRSRYILLNSIARSAGTRVPTLQRRLGTCPVMPAYSASTAQGSLVVYEKDPTLITAIRAALGPAMTPDVERHLSAPPHPSDESPVAEQRSTGFKTSAHPETIQS